MVIKARKVDPVLRGVASKFTKYEQQIYDIYIKAFSQMPNDLNNPAVIEMIRAAIASSNPSGGAISLQWSEFISALDKSIPTLASQLAASANISASALPKSIQISSSFTATDPRAIAWAQQRAGARILGITKESQKAVAETIARGLQGKLNRDEVIDGVTRVVGLDSRQARALGTFYEKNLNSLLDQGLSYENAARAAKKLGERYRDRLIRQRATRIARTETNAAANAGRLLSWSEADIQGLLPTGSEKRWKTSQDERNCPTCRPMHNETVPWQGAFSTGDVMPPAHVNCLCTAVIVPAEAEFQKSLYTPIQKTRKTAWLFAKHGSHNQKTHGKKGGGAPSSVGNFTLDENPEYAKQNLTVYTHPNGTRVIFQDLDKIEKKDPMVKETLEIVDGLSETHPIPNATFVVESENGIVQRGMDGATYTPADGTDSAEAIDAYIRSKGLPAPKDISAPYISIKQRVVAPSIRPKTFPVSGGGTAIRNKTTPEEDRAALRQLITHEWGHALDTRPEALSKSMFAGRGANTTSTYGAKNGREFFAETFAASILGGLSQDSPDSKPDYKAAAEYLGIDSLKKNVHKESFEGFIAYDNFETGESLVIEGRMPSDYYEGFAKHGTHNQKTHGGKGGGEGSTRELLVMQASKYETFEEFSAAISLQGLRPKVWHIADEGFELDPNYKPTDRLGGTTGDSGLFVGDPETWQDYAVGRSTVVEYDVTDLSLTTRPLADTSADFFPDQSGNQGFFIRPSAFPRLKEVKRMTLSEALSRAKKQQDSMPKSKAEARQIWEESRSVKKHGTHNQKTHGGKGGGGGSVAFDSGREKQLSDKLDNITAQIKKLQEKYGVTEYITPGNYRTVLPPEAQEEWVKLDDEWNKTWQERADVRTQFLDDAIEMKSGKSPSDSDFGFSDESFMEIRDEWVVDKNGSTLKTNASLRRTGRVTSKVERFDSLVAEGQVKNPTQVYRAAILQPDQIETMQVGTSFVDRGFQSVGHEAADAVFYGDDRAAEIVGGKVLFEYTLQPGLGAVDVGYGEILVQRGAKVTVTGVTKRGDYTVIQADVGKS